MTVGARCANLQYASTFSAHHNHSHDAESLTCKCSSVASHLRKHWGTWAAVRSGGCGTSMHVAQHVQEAHDDTRLTHTNSNPAEIDVHE